MNRIGVFGLAALALVGCDDRLNVPTGRRAETLRAAQVGAPVPSPLIALALPGQTLQLWPFTGFGFGAQSDPVNLIWIGQADPRALRAALLQLDGDRTAVGFPDVFPFNCTWHDEPEVQPEVAYTAASGWVGSPIMLECGTFDQARFHLRFFDVGGATVGGAPFEVFIPGTLDHQTISWALAEQFVVADFVRSGLLDPALPYFTTGPLNPAPFGTIPAVIYNGIPPALRQAIGGPLGDVTDDVPIASSGHATVLNLRGSVRGHPLVAARRWVQQFNQVIPQPFCAPGPNAFLSVVGPVTLDQDVVFTSSGNYASHFHAVGRLSVTPTDATTGAPIGATYQADVLETHEGELTPEVTSTAFFTRRALLPPSAPAHGTFEFGFAVGPAGITHATARIRCGS
ncbi:MAG TPA: hypothetical protein VEU74_05965 [Gemmatimonadales bacterium]|nr:hypothetical protein [Gemmatimonadales bacterium]